MEAPLSPDGPSYGSASQFRVSGLGVGLGVFGLKGFRA